MMPLLRAFAAIVARDLRLAIRRRGELVQPLVFFVAVATLFPLALGPEQKLLMRIAPGIVWVAALLATLLPLDRMFRSDFEDGTLEQLLLSPRPASVLALGKVVGHWLANALPVIVAAPLVGIFMQLPYGAMLVLLLSLLLGTPVLALLGAIGAALTVGLRAGTPLLALLLLPLYVPVLIFAAGAVDRAASGFAVVGPLYLLGALLVMALVLAPPAIAASLRISLS